MACKILRITPSGIVKVEKGTYPTRAKALYEIKKMKRFNKKNLGTKYRITEI